MDKQPAILPEFEQDIRAALAVPEADAEYLADLRTKVLRQKPVQNRGSHAWPFHWRPVWAISAAAVVLALAVILLAGPDNVLAAIQRLIGYIPNIGFVDNSQPVLQLAEPVEVQQNGVTVRVESAASDGQNTRLNLRVEGLGNIAKQVEADGIPGSHQLALRLADGKALELRGWQVNYQRSYTLRLDFEPLPKGTGEARLSFDVIPGVPAGVAPQGWQLALRFIAGAANAPVAAGSPILLESDPLNGVVLKLLNVSGTAAGTAVQVQLLSSLPHTFVSTSRSDRMYLLDAQGHTIPFTGEPLYSPDGSDTMTLTTQPIASGQAMTLVLKDTLELSRQLDPLETLPAFAIDLGANPTIGQRWDLDETITMGDKTVHLTGAQLIPGTFGSAAQLLFQMDPAGGILGARISVSEGLANVSGYGRMLTFFQEMPHGTIRFQVVGIDYQVDGTWKVDWTMP